MGDATIPLAILERRLYWEAIPRCVGTEQDPSYFSAMRLLERDLADLLEHLLDAMKPLCEARRGNDDQR
jgi:hypothetical protein